MEFMKDIPFSDVYIHGTVRDDKGIKMSKSLGNAIDPLDIIKEFGTDALRFSLIINSGQDLFLSKNKFEVGRNFANKIWNASRLVLMNLKEKGQDYDLCQVFEKEKLTLPERWILSRLYTTMDKINKAIDKYRFNEAENLIYEFFWHEFCDWYLEMAKPFESKTTQIVTYKVLEKSLRIIHPFMPFITEEIWQKLNPQSGPIMMQSIPHIQKQMIDKKCESQMQTLIDLITALRNIRSHWNIPPKAKVDCFLKVTEKNTALILSVHQEIIKKLALVENITISEKSARPDNSAAGVVEKINFFVPLASLIDINKEKSRIEKQIHEQSSILKGLNSRLRNKQFLKKAPKEVVESEVLRQSELKDKIAKLEKVIKELK